MSHSLLLNFALVALYLTAHTHGTELPYTALASGSRVWLVDGFLALRSQKLSEEGSY